MRFRILGPLEVTVDGTPIPLGGRGQVALLAALIVRPNQPISADELIDALWPDRSPDGAVKRLQVAVARLRRALGLVAGLRLETISGGYRLVVAPGELDATQFEEAVSRGRRSLEAADVSHARTILEDSLELWRGPPLVDVAYEPFARPVADRLAETRLLALEARIEADMRLGRHDDLVGEIESLAAEHPDREALTAQLMLALYRSGRQVDALAAFRRARDYLADELGLDPSPSLQQLQERILNHDPSLRSTSVALRAPAPRLAAPVQQTIGREEDVAALVPLIGSRKTRLLTLTGAGGVGKTRLAWEVARALDGLHRDGVRFVPLADVERAHDVAPAIAQALGVVPLTGEATEQAIARHLEDKQLLLVLDNFEHVLSAGSLVARLLAASDGLSVLATTRAPLALAGEWRYPVAPLAAAAAVQLFEQRALQHDPAFRPTVETADAVTRICRRLDGLPLAIELAAARCSLMSAAEIADGLDASRAVLGRGPQDAPARQRTLRATIGWSYALLGPTERVCFARFAVFAGGATIDATEQVTGASLETIGGLVDKSLLIRRQAPAGATRLVMLETIRAFAIEQFEAAGDQSDVISRHFDYYLELARHHGSEPAVTGTDRNVHVSVMDADRENLHAALRRAIDRSAPVDAVALAASLIEYWRQGPRAAEALDYMDQVLALAEDAVESADLVEVLSARTPIARWLGRIDERLDALEKSEAIARRIDDDRLLARVLLNRADEESNHHRLDTCERYAEEALGRAQTSGDLWTLGNVLRSRAMAATTIETLLARVDQAVAASEDAGSPHQKAHVLSSGTYAAICLRGLSEAFELASRGMPLAQALGDDHRLMNMLGNYGLANLLAGDIATASRAFGEQLVLCRQMMERSAAAEGLIGLAAVAAANGEPVRAARLVGAAGTHAYGMEQPDVEELLETRFFTDARAAVGADVWNEARAAGAGLSFQDAIAEALSGASATAGASVPAPLR